MNILFVENHPRFADITIKTFLPQHTVTVVPSLGAARLALAENSFDAVLLDYDLDDGKGTELMPLIHGQPHRPYLVATSSHNPGNDALLAAGADAVCDKMNFSNIGVVLDGAQPPQYQPPTSAAELMARYAEGERVFFDVELPAPEADGDYPDFSGANLEGIIFEGCFLAASFRGAYLSNAVFHYNVKTSDFNGADLRNASFKDCAICGATFESANLGGTDFTGADSYGYIFKTGERP